MYVILLKTMKTEQIVMCVVFLLLGMLLANMLKYVCGCKVVEGNFFVDLLDVFGDSPGVR